MDGGVESKSSISLEQGTTRELGFQEGRIARISSDSRPLIPRKGRFAQPIAIALALVMVAGAGLGAFSLVVKSPGNEKVLLAAPLFMTHSPILIEGEAALTPANGVTGGDGTVNDPFVIQGWDIDASGATAAGIAVTNITSDLVIRNLNVHSGRPDNAGIALINVTNCTVEYSQSNDNLVGIVAVMCGHVVIQNNTVVNDLDEGILVMETNYSLVAHNIEMDGGGLGIALMNSVGSSVVNNTISYNNYSGLALEFCNLTTVSGNSMDHSLIGLFGIAADSNLIVNNVILRSQTYGVYMLSCQNNTLFSNIIADTYPGPGAFLMNCSKNTIYQNDFLGNALGEVTIPQASDDSTTNRWNLSYPIGGNYWSNHAFPDSFSGPDQNIAGSDGIVDTPCTLDPSATAEDHYPLAVELTFGTTPTAAFTVTPASGTTSTVFGFDASLTWYPNNHTPSLEFRWDFDGDGTWDTGWLTNDMVQHSYTQVGEYNVTMEVKDLAGHTSNMTWHVEVDQVVIPEFTTVLIPICSMTAIFLVVGAFGKRR